MKPDWSVTLNKMVVLHSASLTLQARGFDVSMIDIDQLAVKPVLRLETPEEKAFQTGCISFATDSSSLSIHYQLQDEAEMANGLEDFKRVVTAALGQAELGTVDHARLNLHCHTDMARESVANLIGRDLAEKVGLSSDALAPDVFLHVPDGSGKGRLLVRASGSAGSAIHRGSEVLVDYTVEWEKPSTAEPEMLEIDAKLEKLTGFVERLGDAL